MILTGWRYLEADWQREYGRDLLSDVDDNTTSWRWLATRVTGLSKQSVWRAWALDQPVYVTGQAARNVIRNL